jgi:uncharacterized protein affecting Mg2+/Co2+ transport
VYTFIYICIYVCDTYTYINIYINAYTGSGIMSTQPIIAPGDVFTYQSVCPLKVFPPKGKRMLGSMSGAYTMCKGNMGQHNFSAKVGKFNLILPEAIAEKIPSETSPTSPQ